MSQVAVSRITGTGGAGALNTILAENRNRKFAKISNNAGTGVYISIGTGAVIGYGIYLHSQGDSFTIDDNNFVTTVINGCGSGGDIDLAVQTW